jgi:hypothetical protein
MKGTETVTTWRGMKPGHPIAVKGLGECEFRSARLDGSTPIWVTVTYARGRKKSGTRIVTPSRVVKHRARVDDAA